METLLHTTATYPKLKNVNCNGFSCNRTGNGYSSKGPFISQKLSLANGYSSKGPFISQKLSLGLRKSVIVGAKKNRNSKKEDSHSFIPKPDEATGPFPEAVLLKEKKVQEDGKFIPEFADAEEEKLYEYLSLELESELNAEERIRHYEVVYLIHEKHAEEVGKVNEKVEDFLREKKGKIWRLNDWGMRRLAYKIKKATNAHYILMNFEIEAKWINDFKTMLDKDERVIRHLVIKRDEAITEDCPPPLEFHTLRGGMDDNDEDDDEDDDLDYDEDWDGEGEMEGYDDDTEDGITVINSNDIDDGRDDQNNKSIPVNDKGGRNQKREKVGR
ncbi:hypothetical protein JCGZ_19040 [Jatropha curcas]|uniref:Uncharacterized protein n=1 Tax=Jatropha curcas TaxID=180498 RepID=A0A067K6R2_JATCU|nr:uncharacterized protein LOC105643577 [Jatropha curcas]KDP27960.1 hypothetical protein JCGZ_19040 [Jatropha curcas]